MASLGPSERLLNQRRSNKITWHEFKKRYRAELFESKSFDRRNRVIENQGQKFTLRLPQILARRGAITHHVPLSRSEASLPPPCVEGDP